MVKQTYLKHFSKNSPSYEQMASKSDAREKYKFVDWKKARKMGLWFSYFSYATSHTAHSWVHIEAIVCCLCYTNIESLEAAVTELWDLMSEECIRQLSGIVLKTIGSWF